MFGHLGLFPFLKESVFWGRLQVLQTRDERASRDDDTKQSDGLEPVEGNEFKPFGAEQLVGFFEQANSAALLAKAAQDSS